MMWIINIYKKDNSIIDLNKRRTFNEIDKIEAAAEICRDEFFHRLNSISDNGKVLCGFYIFRY